MKNVLYIIIGILTVCSCSDVSESERLEYVRPVDVKRNVLLEEFTGQGCPNCPKAADKIHELQELYGESHIIAVAIHGGPMAWTTADLGGAYEGFKTPLADEYYRAAKIEVNPMGVINRSGGAKTFDIWQAAVNEQLEQSAPAGIAIECKSDDDASLQTEITVSALDDDISGKLQVWIVEDSIVGAQLMPDGSANASYMHRHVLRAAINGAWGEDIAVKKGTSKTIAYVATIEPNWQAQNLAIVAFIYNDKGVMQAAIARLKTNTARETIPHR